MGDYRQNYGLGTPMEGETTREDRGNTSRRRRIGRLGTNIGGRAESVERRQHIASQTSMPIRDIGLTWRRRGSMRPLQIGGDNIRGWAAISGLGPMRGVESRLLGWSQPGHSGSMQEARVNIRGRYEPDIRDTSNQRNLDSLMGWTRCRVITSMSGNGIYAGGWHRRQGMTSTRSVDGDTRSLSRIRGMERTQGLESMRGVGIETGGWRRISGLELTSRGNFDAENWFPLHRSITGTGITIRSQQQRSDPVLEHEEIPRGVQSEQGGRRPNRLLETTRGTLLNIGGWTRSHGFTRRGDQNPPVVPNLIQEDIIGPENRTVIGGWIQSRETESVQGNVVNTRQSNQSSGLKSTPGRPVFHTSLEQTIWERGNRTQAGGMGSRLGDEARVMEHREYRRPMSEDSAELSQNEAMNLTREDTVNAAVRTNAGDRKSLGKIDEVRGMESKDFVELSQNEGRKATREYVAASGDNTNVENRVRRKRTISGNEATGMEWKKYRRSESIHSGEFSRDAEMELTRENVVYSGERVSAGDGGSGRVSSQGDETRGMQWTEYRRTESLDSGELSRDAGMELTRENVIYSGERVSAGDRGSEGVSSQGDEARGMQWTEYRRTESIDSGELSRDAEMELTRENVIYSGERVSEGDGGSGRVSSQGDEARGMQWMEYRRTESIDSVDLTQDEGTKFIIEGVAYAGDRPDTGDGAEAGGSNQ